MIHMTNAAMIKVTKGKYCPVFKLKACGCGPDVWDILIDDQDIEDDSLFVRSRRKVDCPSCIKILKGWGL